MPFQCKFIMNMLPGSPGFGTPIFERNEKFYVQYCENGRISSFEQIEISDNFNIPDAPGSYFDLGDEECCAFHFNTNDILVGSRRTVSAALAERWSEFSERTFLLMEVADFIGDAKLADRQFLAIKEMESFFHRATNFEDWKPLRQPPADRFSRPTRSTQSDSSFHRYWRDLIGRIQLDVKADSSPSYQATFVAEPLERGFGLTLGNALRRVLLSSLPGAAITTVHIKNVLHELSSLVGVREDVPEIVRNLKGVNLKMDVAGPRRLTISAKGPGVVTAGDISASPVIRILNPEHVICNLDIGADVFMELTAMTGKGYVAADVNRPEVAQIGLIPLDAIFSPVSEVSYEVQPTREGEVPNCDRLTLKVETNGSLTPDEALAFAARILRDHLAAFMKFENSDAESNDFEESRQVFDPMLLKKVDEFGLSGRSVNCLRNANIVYIGDLIQRTEAEMLRTPNFGRKSLNEIKEALSGLGLHLGMEVEDWPPDDVVELGRTFEHSH